MDMTLREMLPGERRFSYTTDNEVIRESGCIGHLRGDMDSGGNGFYTSWDDHTPQMNDAAFKEEFDNVVNMLRFDERYGEVLKNRSSLAASCYAHPASAFEGNYAREFGFRADTRQHSYMIRCNPNKGDYNFYIYCYRREMLDRVLAQQKSKAVAKETPIGKGSVLNGLKAAAQPHTAEKKTKEHSPSL